VYDRGSFNQAAQNLLMSQSAVSQHIQSLEAAVGGKLFERTTKGVCPTVLGEVVYTHAQQILAQLVQLDQAISEQVGLINQPLTLGATSGVSHFLLPRWIKQFQALHPAVKVSIKTSFNDAVVQGVTAGHYAFGVTVGETATLPQTQVDWQIIRQIEYFVVVPRHHPWGEQIDVTPDQLMTAPFLNRRPTSRFRIWLESEFRHRIHLTTVAEFDTPSMIIQALRNDVGVSILPEHVIKDEIERGDVIALPVQDFQLKRPLLLFWKKTPTLSAIQHAFIEALPADYQS
ncbi:MAG: LysR family transcriptional regulator, partial [Chloroflexota bacterium]